TAFLVLPAYLAARAAGLQDYSRQYVCGLVSGALAGLAVVLVFALARRVGLSESGAIVAALTLALCTPLRSYSTVIFHPAAAAGFVTLIAYLATPREGEALAPKTLAGRVGLGLALGYVVVIDYSAAVVSAIVLCVLFWTALRSHRLGTLLPIAAGF